MLYDPRWEKKPTYAGFVAWLETKNPKERYEWGNCGNCAIAQYLKLFGINNVDDIPYDDYAALEGGDNFIAMNEPWTFGAVLERARAAKTSTV